MTDSRARLLPAALGFAQIEPQAPQLRLLHTYLRGRTWWLDFMHGGKRHVVRLGKNISRTVAGELARVQRGAILKGEAGIGGPKLKDPTFDDAAKEFTAWADTNRKARTAKDYRVITDRLKATFGGGRRLSQIDELSIERHKRARATAPIAVNRELAVLKRLFNRCRDDLRIYDGPTPRIRLLREHRGRLRFLAPDEEAALLAHAGEPLRTIILVGILELTRFRGHPMVWGERIVHDAEEPSAVPTGVPAAHHRFGAEGAHARGAGAPV